MPGQDGGFTTTNQNLTIVKVDAEEGYILVKGNVPGPRKGYLVIKTTVNPVKHVNVEPLISYQKEEEPKVEEVVEETVVEEEAPVEAVAEEVVAEETPATEE